MDEKTKIISKFFDLHKDLINYMNNGNVKPSNVIIGCHRDHIPERISKNFNTTISEFLSTDKESILLSYEK